MKELPSNNSQNNSDESGPTCASSENSASIDPYSRVVEAGTTRQVSDDSNHSIQSYPGLAVYDKHPSTEDRNLELLSLAKIGLDPGKSATSGEVHVNSSGKNSHTSLDSYPTIKPNPGTITVVNLWSELPSLEQCQPISSKGDTTTSKLNSSDNSSLEGYPVGLKPNYNFTTEALDSTGSRRDDVTGTSSFTDGSGNSIVDDYARAQCMIECGFDQVPRDWHPNDVFGSEDEMEDCNGNEYWVNSDSSTYV